MNIKYRIKFTKEDKMRFVGHLDLMNVFRRAIKRAGLPVAFSQGFNPHQLISFALPLPMGMASLGDYADFVLSHSVNSNDIITGLNGQMPNGLQVIACAELLPGAKSAGALVCAALYEISFNKSINEICAQILNSDEIIIKKKSKSKDEYTNVRPHIHDIKIMDDCRINAIFSAGSNVNLKAEHFVNYISETSPEPYEAKIVRLDLLKQENGKMQPII